MTASACGGDEPTVHRTRFEEAWSADDPDADVTSDVVPCGRLDLETLAPVREQPLPG